MSSIRTYLIVVCGLLAVAIGFGVYVWYKIQTLDLEPQEVLPAEYIRDSELQNERLEQSTSGT